MPRYINLRNFVYEMPVECDCFSFFNKSNPTIIASDPQTAIDALSVSKKLLNKPCME